VKRLVAAVLCLNITAGLTGCQQPQKKPAVEPAPPFKAVGDTVSGRKDIYLIVKNLGSSYWQVIIDGAEDAAEEFGCNMYYSGSNAESDWRSQERLLDEAVEAGADAVLLAPNDAVELAPKIDEVHDAGVKVVLIDTTANTENYDICYMTDNLMAGQLAAKEMLKQLKNSGNSLAEPLKVGIQVGAQTSLSINERLAGFLQYWTRNAPKDWVIIPDIKCNDGDYEKAVTCAAELFDEDPDIKGVFGTNNGSGKGFAKEIKKRGLNDVVLVSFDYSPEVAELIQSDEYTASTILQRQYHMVHTGVETALALTAGKHFNEKFVDTGVVVVNRNNMQTAEIQEILSHS